MDNTEVIEKKFTNFASRPCKFAIRRILLSGFQILLLIL
jgi:hypothetical protein